MRGALLGFKAGLFEPECLGVLADSPDFGPIEAVRGYGGDLETDLQLGPLHGGEVLNHLSGDPTKVARVEVWVQGDSAEEPGLKRVRWRWRGR